MQFVGSEVGQDATLVELPDLADRDGAGVLVDERAHLAQVVVQRRPVPLARRLAGDVVAVGGVLAEAVDRVEPDAVHAPVQPAAHDVELRGPDGRVGPVQVGFLGQVGVQVPLGGGWMPRPGGAARREAGGPVVRWAAVGATGRGAVAPDVVAAHPGDTGGRRVAEPRMLVTGVRQHDVDEDAHVMRMGRGDERVRVGVGAEDRVDGGVVADVVAEVDHRGSEERRDPQGVDAEGAQVGKPLDEAGQVADPVPVAVGEAARINLVDDGVLPPWPDWSVSGGAGHGPPRRLCAMWLEGEAKTAERRTTMPATRPHVAAVATATGRAPWSRQTPPTTAPSAMPTWKATM
jgi:hypothetical protein